MNYNNPYYYNPYYFPYTPYPQNYGPVYPERQQQEPAIPYYSVYEVHALTRPEGEIIQEDVTRPEEIIQEDVTCAGGKKGQKIGGETFSLEFFKIGYEAYECEIKVFASIAGIRSQTWTLKRGKSDFEWKLDIPFGGGIVPPGTHKLVGWMVGRSFLMRYEYRVGGRVRTQIKPFTVATFPKLRFFV